MTTNDQILRTIEEQAASLDRTRGACRAAISDLERNIGIMHALPATLKLAGALDALDAIQATFNAVQGNLELKP